MLVLGIPDAWYKSAHFVPGTLLLDIIYFSLLFTLFLLAVFAVTLAQYMRRKQRDLFSFNQSGHLLGGTRFDPAEAAAAGQTEQRRLLRQQQQQQLNLSSSLSAASAAAAAAPSGCTCGVMITTTDDDNNQNMTTPADRNPRLKRQHQQRQQQQQRLCGPRASIIDRWFARLKSPPPHILGLQSAHFLATTTTTATTATTTPTPTPTSNLVAEPRPWNVADHYLAAHHPRRSASALGARSQQQRQRQSAAAACSCGQAVNSWQPPALVSRGIYHHERRAAAAADDDEQASGLFVGSAGNLRVGVDGMTSGVEPAYEWSHGGSLNDDDEDDDDAGEEDVNDDDDNGEDNDEAEEDELGLVEGRFSGQEDTLLKYAVGARSDRQQPVRRQPTRGLARHLDEPLPSRAGHANYCRRSAAAAAAGETTTANGCDCISSSMSHRQHQRLLPLQSAYTLPLPINSSSSVH